MPDTHLRLRLRRAKPRAAFYPLRLSSIFYQGIFLLNGHIINYNYIELSKE